MNGAELLRVGLETAIVAQLALFSLFLLATADKRHPAGFFLAALCCVVAATLLINALASAGVAPRLRTLTYYLDLALAPLVLGFAARAGGEGPALRGTDAAHLLGPIAGALVLVAGWPSGPDLFVLVVHFLYLAAAGFAARSRLTDLRAAGLLRLTSVLIGAFALVWLLRLWVVLDSQNLASYRASLAYVLVLLVVLGLASFMLWAALRTPGLLAWPNAKLPKGLSDEDAGALERRLMALLDDERLYLDPQVTLSQIAAKLRVSPRFVSRVVSLRLGENLPSLLNRKRAEAAARALSAPEAASVTSIMYDSGFGSKSAFQREFKRCFGVSPTEYRRQHIARENG